MCIVPKNKNRIHSVHFNPKQYYGTMSNEEKAYIQNKIYYAKYKYLEAKNSHREVLLVTFTTKTKDIHFIQQIKTKFLSFLKNDKTIKGTYSYIWTIELGENKNNPHLHCMIWYDKESLDRINLHYVKTIKKFDLVKKRSQLTLQRKVASYILKEFSILNKQFEDYYVARKNMKKTLKKSIKFIGFSSFEYTEKVYKYFYQLGYDYLQTDELLLKRKLLLQFAQIFLMSLLQYKDTIKSDRNYQDFNTINLYKFFTLTLKINKKIIMPIRWQFPFVYVFT